MGADVNRVFSEADLDRITQAVQAAEAKSSGEIAVVIVPHSRTWFMDGGIHSALWAVIAGLSYLFILRYDNWGAFYPFRQATIVSIAVFGLALMFFSFWSFRPAILTRACWRNALKHFAALSATQGQTAVLILVSLAEERAAIVADVGIARKVPADYWHKPQSMIAKAMEEGGHVQGLTAAIAEIGGTLAQHFPRAADDVNELPDRPQIG